jgi:integrase
MQETRTMDARPIPWSDFRTEVLSLYTPPLRTIATYRKMEHTFRQIEALGAIETTAALTPALVAALVTSRPPALAPRTVQGLLRSVRVICTFAMHSRYIETSPFLIRPVGKWIRLGPPAERRFLSRDEIRRVLDQAAHEASELRGWPGWRARRTQAAVTIACYCGLRKSELLRLWVEDVDLERRFILVVDRTRLKTSASAQPVPVPTAAVETLKSWLSHRLDRPSGIKVPESLPWLLPNTTLTGHWHGGCQPVKPTEMVKALAKRAGVEGATLHAMRRSLATHLEGSGMSQPLITRILRHTSELTTKRWYQMADIPNLVAGVEGFSYDRP